MESSSFIRLREVTKTYGKGEIMVQALRGIDLDIAEGEFVAIMGQSGSGKSTLMHILGGLDQPTTGTIEVGGKTVGSMSAHELAEYRNRTVGFVFQFFYLQPYLSVTENVEVPLIFRKDKPDERKARALAAIESVGLKERANHLPSQLSGGQMQRTAIARAIVGEPRLILADEPTGNLDKKTGEEILELLRGINKEKRTTVVMITHDEHVAGLADRIIRISDGSIV